MEFSVDLDQTATKSGCDEKWHGIFMGIHAIFFTGTYNKINSEKRKKKWTRRFFCMKKEKSQEKIPDFHVKFYDVRTKGADPANMTSL